MTTLTIGVDSWKQLGLTPDAAAYVQFTPTAALLDGTRPRSAAPWVVSLDKTGAAVTELPAPKANYGLTVIVGAPGFAAVTVSQWPEGSVDLATLLRDYDVDPDTFAPLDPLPPSAAEVLATAETAVAQATAASVTAGTNAASAGQAATAALGSANAAATQATEVATLASIIAAGSMYAMNPILTGGDINTPRPTLPGGAPWPGRVYWSSQIGRPTNYLQGTDAWESIAADPIPPAVYFADNFNRADGAPGASPTGAITPTVLGTGTLSILSNALGWSALPSGTDYVTWDAGHADGIFEITVSAMEAAAGIGITFRLASATNHLWMGRVSSTTKNWRFGKRVGSATFVEVYGPTTTPAAPVVPMAVGDVVRVILNGTTVTININGVQWYTGTVTEQATNTKHGFSGTNPSVSGASKFDNASMTALA